MKGIMDEYTEVYGDVDGEELIGYMNEDGVIDLDANAEPIDVEPLTIDVANVDPDVLEPRYDVNGAIIGYFDGSTMMLNAEGDVVYQLEADESSEGETSFGRAVDDMISTVNRLPFGDSDDSSLIIDDDSDEDEEGSTEEGTEEGTEEEYSYEEEGTEEGSTEEGSTEEGSTEEGSTEEGSEGSAEEGTEEDRGKGEAVLVVDREDGSQGEIVGGRWVEESDLSEDDDEDKYAGYEITPDDCESMTVKEIKNTTMYKNIKGRSKLPNGKKATICNAIKQLYFPETLPSDFEPYPGISLSVAKESGKKVTERINGGKPSPARRQRLTVVEEGTIDDRLVKAEDESQRFFDMRSAYARKVVDIFGSDVNFAAAVVLGRAAANRAMYGLDYPDDLRETLEHVDDTILAESS